METMVQKKKEIQKTVRENLKQLMEVHGLTVSNFCNFIENKNEPVLSRSNFTKFMNEKVNEGNLAFLVYCTVDI